MASLETTSFSVIVEQFLGTRLPGSLADTVCFAELSTEAREVILRALALMRRASYPATELTSYMIWLLAAVTPGMLPSAWGDRIPPVTSPGRHRKLDAYIARQTWSSNNGPPVYIDLGCGFPPVTSADTARNLPDWTVYGVDRSFARYVLFDSQGHYACFDRHGKFLYFQPHLKPLHDSPKALRDRFETLFAQLFPRMPSCGDHASETVELDGSKLICNHVRDFETHNLTFIESDVEDLLLMPAQAIRCMNVLLYFEKGVRQKMRLSMGALLEDDGLLISGFNHPFGIYARYAVYKKDATGLKPCEFAFSPDNLRPIGVGPWLTIKDDDEEAELLADVTGAIRADQDFWMEFNRDVDVRLENLGICRRGDDGFLHFTEEFQTPSSIASLEKTTTLWHQLEAAGYTDGAVEALRRAGYQTWKNPVGDIAVLPPEGLLR